jgi:uncharacterized membrane protein
MIIAGGIVIALAIVIWLVVRCVAGRPVYPVFMGKVPDREKEALKRANKR